MNGFNLFKVVSSNRFIPEDASLITPFYKNMFIKLIYYFLYCFLIYLIFKNLILYSFILIDYFIVKFKIMDIFQSSFLTKEKILSLKHPFIFVLKLYMFFLYLYILNQQLWIKVYINKNALFIIKKSLWDKSLIHIPLEKIQQLEIKQNLIQKLFRLYSINIIHNASFTINNINLEIDKFHEYVYKIYKN
jgi:membrane protein YdbS with pleckstrin-like domain